MKLSVGCLAGLAGRGSGSALAVPCARRGWLFQSALGSVLIAMVFHAMNNAVSGEYVSQMFDGSDSTRQSWMLVIVRSAAAVLVVRFGRTFRRRQR